MRYLFKIISSVSLILFSFSLSTFLLFVLFKIYPFFIIPQQLEVHKEVINILFFKNIRPVFLPESEYAHIIDVRNVIGLVILLFLISLYILFIDWKKKYTKPKELFIFSLVILVALFALFLIFPFESSFRYMHLIFFPQGNWEFPLESVLIKTYPVEFWKTMGYMFWSIAALTYALFLWVYKKLS